MAMFIVLGKFTDEGGKNLRDLGQRNAAVRDHGDKLGIKLHGWYLTQGQYDFVIIAEAPDDETMLKQSVFARSRGFARGETLRAYPMDEVRPIIESI